MIESETKFSDQLVAQLCNITFLWAAQKVQEICKSWILKLQKRCSVWLQAVANGR